MVGKNSPENGARKKASPAKASPPNAVGANASSENASPRWRFLSNHAQVLVCIAHDPGIRLREISESVGITERAAHRIVVELAAAGYITRTRKGRRNSYVVHSHIPLPDALARGNNVGDLLSVLRPN